MRLNTKYFLTVFCSVVFFASCDGSRVETVNAIELPLLHQVREIRAIDQEMLNVRVSINNEDPIAATRNEDGSKWRLEIQRSDYETTTHTIEIVWSENTNQGELLLAEFGGEFELSETTNFVTPTGEFVYDNLWARFDDDQDCITNIDERNALNPSDPYSGIPTTCIPDMTELPIGCFNIGADTIDQHGAPRNICFDNNIAISVYEITFNQYASYLAQIGSDALPSDDGWGFDNRPVINVSWRDAENYTRWLSEKTGTLFRLPTEAEWEYATRATTTMIVEDFNTGSDISIEQANFGQIHAGTLPIGSLESKNGFGLYDTHGNVFEWTCSLYQTPYSGEETSCVSNTVSDSRERVFRGGAWNSEKNQLKSGSRGTGKPDLKENWLGFRIVRL